MTASIVVEPMREVPLSELRVSPENPRTIKPARLEQLKRALEADPAMLHARPLVALPDGTVIAGNQRLLAAQALGWPSIPVVFADLDRERARMWMLRDNQGYGEWDDGALTQLLSELEAGGADLDLAGFEDKQLRALLAARPDRGDPDLVPPLPDAAVSQRGEVYQLGPHRLMCGDATSREDTATLLGGELIDFVFTSPPYGVGLEYEQGDTLDDLAALIEGFIERISEVCKPDAYATVNYADVIRPGDPGWTPMTPFYHRPFVEHGWALRGNRVWFKPFGRLSLSFSISTTLNLREWEFVQTWRRGRGAEVLRDHGTTLRGVWKTFGEDAIVSDWQDLDVTTDKAIHPAAFPVVLPVTAFRCYTDPGDSVYDPFAGSGTTLIAAEMQARRCFAMEIEPRYCDLIRQRYADYMRG